MIWEKGTLADFLQDRVVYRNLEPMDESVVGLRRVWRELGFDHYYVPRKTTPEYARALVFFLQSAQRGRGLSRGIERVLFIGDTLMNDGTAARNVGMHLPMMGFIGADRLDAPVSIERQGDLLVANRWQALSDYWEWVCETDFPCDEQTALLVDLDKTSLGARGRNDHVIDRARIRAVMRTMRDALGETFDVATFRSIYDPLNQPDYHFFTADNQDYLAYICLMVSGGVCESTELWRLLRDGTFGTFDDFVALCDERRERMSAGLRQAHDEVCEGIAAEDPTPYKGFRRGEFFETVDVRDVLPDTASAEEVLSSEIVITREVAGLASDLAGRGVLVFGISDKPDEASVPLPEDAARGYRPIHRTPMKMYGNAVV